MSHTEAIPTDEGGGRAVEMVDHMPRDASAYAQRLYAALRELDAAGCEAILVEAPPPGPEWAAVRDRLERACGQSG